VRLLSLGASLLLALSPAAHAAFEDAPYSPRASALGGAMTAVPEDPVAGLYNPAMLGSLRKVAVSAGFLRQFHTPPGETDQDLFNVTVGVPVFQELFNGTFALAETYNRQNKLGIERTTGIHYGTRSLFEYDGGGVDVGGAFKFLKKSYNEGGGNPTHIALDLGSTARFKDKYTLGFSLINLGRPRFQAPSTSDRAPTTMRLGFTEAVHGFLLTQDFVKREQSGGHSGNHTLSFGMERWWATARSGSWAGRTGLSLGDRNKTFNWGVGWRLFGGQLDYSMAVPMQGKTIFGHAVSLLFRFGESNPEGEYERVLSQELKYRKDLTQALEASDIKLWRLAEELSRMREEMGLLRQQLLEKTTSEAEARKRLRDIEDRHKKAEDRFRDLQAERKRLAERSQQDLFKEDWTAYQKLKLGGAPDSVLTDQVKRLLRQYKDTGADLSDANKELLRLLRAR
jgi:hypothetical protein